MGQAASKQEAFWEACGFGHINRVKKFMEDGDIDVNWVSYTVRYYCIIQMYLEYFCLVNTLIWEDRWQPLEAILNIASN